VSLETYRQKRDFKRTNEPAGKTASGGLGHRFVVQEHHATRLHFDLRLEMGGVLKSWAVPKGPSLDPSVKRLAVPTEDHPLEYLSFTGHIPEGNYGAGDMAIWDTGTYEVPGGSDPETGFEAGKLDITFHGEKLRGAFHMFRWGDEGNWMLVKREDEFADPNWTLQTVIDEKKPLGAKTTTAKVAEKPKVAKMTEPAPAAGFDISKVAGAERRPMPGSINPMLATLVESVPATGEWVYEVKWDGYRALAFIKAGVASLISRNQNDLTPMFPTLAERLAKFPLQSAILDGEVVALDEKGNPSFQRLQNATGIRSSHRRRRSADVDPASLRYYAFDLLYCEGFDLTGATLRDRKALLERILKAAGDIYLPYSEDFPGPSAARALLENARQEGLEGVVGKRADSHYVQRRSDNWIKIKLHQEWDVVLGGYTEPRGGRKHFGALLLGLYQGEDLVPIGHTGTGFDQKSLAEIHAVLTPLETDQCPFQDIPGTNERPHWIRPELVATVRFGEVTTDGQLRHPVFVGLRPDKDPRDCRFNQGPVRPVQPEEEETILESTKQTEPAAKSKNAREKVEDVKVLLGDGLRGDLTVQAGDHAVHLTNLHKVYWPGEGITKGQLLRYYYQISETILPYLRDRPQILQRYPNGIEGKPFFQHNVETAPPFVDLYEHEEGGQTIHSVICNNLAALLYVVNLGTIATNLWESRRESPGIIDWLVFDLDPGTGVKWSAVCELALEIKAALEAVGLAGYPKTSGATGLHIYLPLEPVYAYEQARDFGMILADSVTKRRPDLSTLERSLSKRNQSLIYLDVLQNMESKTVTGPWSVRARPGATVSTPLTWAEVAKKPDPAKFTIANIPARIKRRGDEFRPVLDQPQRLEPAVEKLERLLGAPADEPKRRK